MKRLYALSVFFSLILFPIYVLSQNQPPTGIPQPAIGYNDWYRGGNLGNNSQPNIIGTFWGSPMYFYTNGTAGDYTNIRMKINPSFTGAGAGNQYNINGYTWAAGVNTSGYVGIGQNDPLVNNQNLHLWTNKGPFSLLHLNGENYHHVQELGYRPWMKAGTTITSNNDLMYVGHRKNGDGVSENI